MKMLKLGNIKWETDGEDVELPDTIEVHADRFTLGDGKIDMDGLSDWLSDEYGFLHNGFDVSEN